MDDLGRRAQPPGARQMRHGAGNAGPVTAPKSALIARRTWCLGLASWLSLLVGMPLFPIAFIGCVGGVLNLGAVFLAGGFVTLAMRDTQGANSRYRVLGLLFLLGGMVLAGWCAWEAVSIFGLKYQARTRFHVDGPESPSVSMILTLWREGFSWVRSGSQWAGAAVLFAAGLRLLGEKSRGWLAAAFLCAGATGPILVATCVHLVKQGWQSGN
jgi:hypothetical protein